jgi:HTH-type transcriptional regulator/antitoxin HigA
MTRAPNNNEFNAIVLAWRKLQTCTPVKFHVMDDQYHYQAMVALMDKLVDEIGDGKSHPLADLLDVVTFFICEHEERHVEIEEAAPSDVLRFLLEQHGLRDTDLGGILGHSNASQILKDKRITAPQARTLAKRFGVNPAVFV